MTLHPARYISPLVVSVAVLVALLAVTLRSRSGAVAQPIMDRLEAAVTGSRAP